MLATTTACGLDEQPIPAPSGPSGLANAVTLTASPSLLPRDGSSTSTVTITATDAAGGPRGGQRVLLSVSPSEAQLSAGEVTTDSNGRAVVVVTAPPITSGAASVDVAGTPIGGFSDGVSTFVRISLTGETQGVAPPPTVEQITVSPASPIVGQTATLIATASAATGHRIESYTWTFGDGSSDTTTSATTTHAFSKTGTSIVTVTARDDLGQAGSVSESVNVVSGVTASFSISPTNPRVGETVRFDPRSSTIAAGIAVKEYRWDFGNGGTETTTPASPVASTSFGSARTFTIRLTVVDTGDNTTTTTSTLTVAPP
jgi:PKD repeat protein